MSVEETGSIAAELLPMMLSVGTVSLEGPLGAGKTHFVKAVAVALGIRDEVTSPTFNLLHSYGSGSKRLYHSDWYRLESSSEAQALDLEDYHGDGLLIIEWGNKFPELLTPGALRILIEPLEAGNKKRLISWQLATP